MLKLLQSVPNNLMCPKLSPVKVSVLPRILAHKLFILLWMFNAAIDENPEIVCLCQRKKFGRMMKCENSQCEKRWFHFSCIGLSRRPLGVWYCQECDGKLVM